MIIELKQLSAQETNTPKGAELLFKIQQRMHDYALIESETEKANRVFDYEPRNYQSKSQKISRLIFRIMILAFRK